MYSFTPIATEYFSTGFMIFCVLFFGFFIFVFSYMAYVCFEVSGKKLEIPGFLCLAVVLFFAIVGYFAMQNNLEMLDKPRVYKNEKFVGRFVQFSNEAIINRSGKTGTSVTRQTYVTYKIEGVGMVTLPANTNYVYPEFATIYRN